MSTRALSVLALLEVVVVGYSAHAYGHGGGLATVAGLALAPVAVFATAAAGRRLAGPRVGLTAAFTYVLLPGLASAYMLSTYRSTFRHGALPEILGLRATGGLAVGVVAVVAIALVPETVTAAAGALLALAAVLVYGVHGLSGVKLGLHETAWSITAIEWLFVAGVFGTARRSWRLALALGGFLFAAVLHAADHGYANAEFWRHLAVAAPAAALLITGLVFLVPRLRPAPAPERAR